MGRGRSIEQDKKFRVWQDIFYGYFKLDQLSGFSLKMQQQVLNELSKVAPAMVDRASLLNELLNLNIPESDYVSTLSPQERQDELIWFMITLLKTRAAQQSLVIVLEDAHWLDELSWKFTVLLAVSAIKDQTPMLLTIATRLMEGDNAD